MNLCACDRKESEYGDKCEDVDTGCVCSREVPGSLGTLVTEEGTGRGHLRGITAFRTSVIREKGLSLRVKTKGKEKTYV
jgi:hypothetical protein